MKAIQASARKHSIDVKRSQSPRYSIQSTRSVGKYQDLVMKQIRTLKAATESKIGRKLEIDEPRFDWLVKHSNFTQYRFAIKANGCTPYKNVNGTSCHGELLEFGEMCMFRIPVNKQGRKGKQHKIRKAFHSSQYGRYSE